MASNVVFVHQGLQRGRHEAHSPRWDGQGSRAEPNLARIFRCRGSSTGRY